VFSQLRGVGEGVFFFFSGGEFFFCFGGGCFGGGDVVFFSWKRGVGSFFFFLWGVFGLECCRGRGFICGWFFREGGGLGLCCLVLFGWGGEGWGK